MNIYPAQCQLMASLVAEYCALIDHFNDLDGGKYWLRRMEKLLPQLHAAVVALDLPTETRNRYHLPNDDLRCELFVQLNELLLSDGILWSELENSDLKQCLCEQLADDFTDIYFDLKSGLDLLKAYPNQPRYAASNWRASFYVHWGQHLVDAEGWLHAVEVRNYTNTTAVLQLHSSG